MGFLSPFPGCPSARRSVPGNHRKTSVGDLQYTLSTGPDSLLSPATSASPPATSVVRLPRLHPDPPFSTESQPRRRRANVYNHFPPASRYQCQGRATGLCSFHSLAPAPAGPTLEWQRPPGPPHAAAPAALPLSLHQQTMHPSKASETSAPRTPS